MSALEKQKPINDWESHIKKFGEIMTEIGTKRFDEIYIENTENGKVGAEIGKAREVTIKSLLKKCLGIKNDVEITDPSLKGVDTIINGECISIKSPMTSWEKKGLPESCTVKWRVHDFEKFKKDFKIDSHLLYVGFWRTKYSGPSIYFIPKHVQQEILEEVGRDKYLKKPNNSNTVFIPRRIMDKLVKHQETLKYSLSWEGIDMSECQNGAIEKETKILNKMLKEKGLGDKYNLS